MNLGLRIGLRVGLAVGLANLGRDRIEARGGQPQYLHAQVGILVRVRVGVRVGVRVRAVRV